MSDKEERIYVQHFKHDICKDCMRPEYCKRLGIECAIKEQYEDAIPKQEAIEVIKKSLEQIQCWPDSFNDIIAETALNALLEGGKK